MRLKRVIGRIVGLPLLAALALTAGCTAGGQDVVDHPGARKFTWFSYLKGEDLAAMCAPGAANRLRFVYNAVYVEQVRTYDLEPGPAGGQLRLTERVTGPTRIDDIAIDLANPDLFAPGRAKKARVDLPAGEGERLVRALRADGFSTKAPPARGIDSIEFYWVVSGCINGRFALNAWVWPETDLGALAFAQLLAAWDMTGVALNPPRKTDTFSIYGASQPEKVGDFANYFRLRFDRS